MHKVDYLSDLNDHGGLGHKNGVSHDRWSLLAGSVIWKCIVPSAEMCVFLRQVV